MGMPVGMHARELHDNQGFEGNYLTTFLLIKKYFEKKAPGGRVVSAANWQAWGLEFDSSRSQTIFFGGIKSFEQYIACNFELN